MCFVVALPKFHISKVVFSEIRSQQLRREYFNVLWHIVQQREGEATVVGRI